MMKHSASFRRVLVLVYGTVVVFALLITGIYTVVSPQIFAGNKIDRLGRRRKRRHAHPHPAD